MPQAQAIADRLVAGGAGQTVIGPTLTYSTFIPQNVRPANSPIPPRPTAQAEMPAPPPSNVNPSRVFFSIVNHK